MKYNFQSTFETFFQSYYNFIFILEPPPPSPLHKSQTFGYVTSVYKATNTKNGQYVALRRIHGFRLVNTKCMVLVDQWKKLQHANLVSLRQVFTTKSFNDHSMVFVYDFYPGAETLFSRHFSGSTQMGSGNGGGGYMDVYRYCIFLRTPVSTSNENIK